MSQVTMRRIRATYKARDSWWTVLLVDPFAARLVQLTVGYRSLTPTRLTVAAFLIGAGAAWAFFQATPGWLVAGAALYYLSFAVDCVDGKIARLRAERSVFGSWLDFALDRVRVFVCTVALFAGLYQATGDALFLYAGLGVVFLSLIGYLNGAETDRLRARMGGTAGKKPAPARSQQRAAPARGVDEVRVPATVQQVRRFLHRHRIRMNLVSAIEFEMALFVVAPLVAAVAGPFAVLVVVAVAAPLLIMFELALVARFVITARSFDRAAAAPVPGQRGPGRPEPGRPDRQENAR